MAQIAKAIADARELMYGALVAAQRDDWKGTAEALEDVERRLRDLLALVEERAAA